MNIIFKSMVRHMVQLNYNFTKPCMNLHGSPQYHRWFLLTGSRIPRFLTVHERGTMKLRIYMNS